MRSLSASVRSSVEPLRRKRTFSQASRASWRRLSIPALYAARPNSNALEPAISVRSRSKKTAAVPACPRPEAPPPGASVT